MIIPGKGTANFKIGSLKSSIDFSKYDIIEIENREVLEVIKTEFIWFFINLKNNTLDQICVFSPFNEKVLGKIGIGDTLSMVHKEFGKCVINHKVHEPIKYPGISFETKNDSKGKSAVIDCISVSNPYPFYPTNNATHDCVTKKRKLP